MGAHYQATVSPGFLGTTKWIVEMNGWKEVERCDTMREAQLRAAALNYQNGDPLPYAMIGLDGTDLHYARGYSGEVYIGSNW